MPTYKPKFDNTDVKPCLDLAEKWQNWKPSKPSPTTKEFKDLKTLQKMVYLSTLLEGKLLSNVTLTKMEKVNNFDDEHHQVRGLWFDIATKHRYEPSFKPSLAFVQEFASKPKLVAPLLRQLLKWDGEKKQQVHRMMKTFKNAPEINQLVIGNM